MENKNLLNDEELGNVVGGFAEEDHKQIELNMIDEINKNVKQDPKEELNEILKNLMNGQLDSSNKKKGI